LGAGPTPAAALLSSLAVALGALGEGQGCTPPPLYKEGGLGEESTTQLHEPLLPWTPPSTSTWPPTTSTSLSLPRGLPKGCVGGISHHRCTPSCCGVSGSLSNAIYFCNLCWNKDSRSHRDHRTCVSTQRCHSCDTGVVSPRSSRP
jgi:hypothetical protein